MPTFRDFNLIAVAVAGLALSACQPQQSAETEPPVDTSEVIATVNGEPITQAAYDQFLARLNRPVHPDKEQEKKIILDEMIKRMLLAQYATRNKLDRELDTYLTLGRQREAVLLTAARRKILDSAPPLTEADLKARYDAEIAQAPRIEYHARHILLKTEEDAVEAVKALKKGKKFDQLAKKISIGPSKDKGGDLGWLREGMVVPEFFAAVSALKKGEYTNVPIKTQFGWHVVKLVDTRPLTPAPFDKIKDQVEALVRQEQLEAKVAELRRQASVQIGGEQEPPAPPAEKG